MSLETRTDQLDQFTADDPRLHAYLFTLFEAGEKVVQSIGRQADLQAQPTPEGQTPNPIVDVAEQFERVSRATRRNILLVRHITQQRAANEASGPAHNPASRRIEARKRIIREVEDAIQSEPGTYQETEPLRAEFRERLDAPDLDDEIAHRPVADIITDICRDLGLDDPFNFHPQQRRTPRDVQALAARAAAPTPPGPYNPGPHGPDPGAPKPKHPLRPPDLAREHHELVQLAKSLASR